MHNTLTQTNHIHIHSFGDEDTSTLRDVIGKMLDELPAGTPGLTVISKVMSLIYANPDLPQNHTVYIPNKRDNIPYIKNGDTWETRSEIDLYPAMLSYTCDTIQNTQDFRLADTEDGRVVLAKRSEHVKAAYAAEKEALADRKVTAQMIRPLLYRKQP